MTKVMFRADDNQATSYPVSAATLWRTATFGSEKQHYMQIETTSKAETPESRDPEPELRFFPSGAIVFFILLVILALLFWYGIYFLMIKRS